jgi:tight adherence protein C
MDANSFPDLSVSLDFARRLEIFSHKLGLGAGWLWDHLLAGHWLLAGAANALVLVVLGRILVFGYREHSYLYQFDDRSRALDTWIDFLIPAVKRLSLRRYRADVSLKLSRSGTRKDWTANHFMASQLLFALAAGGATFVFAAVLLGLGKIWVLGVMGFAMLLPYLKLTDVASSRYKACNRDLPYFIDYLSLAMSAGLDFNQAMATVVADAPKSPLSGEFALVMRNMRLGMSRAEAMLEMERRLSSPALKLFVQTMIQGMELGTDVVQTLASMSETMQQKRFQAAEELAGKISVRMMIPMMCFVMPSVMIVLLGPMVLTYVKAG